MCNVEVTPRLILLCYALTSHETRWRQSFECYSDATCGLNLRYAKPLHILLLSFSFVTGLKAIDQRPKEA